MQIYKKQIEQYHQEGSNDKIGYHGDDPDIPAIVPRGSVVAFSSRTFHRSGANTTDRARRLYLAQYSVELIKKKNSLENWAQAVPLLQNGALVMR